MPEYFIMYALIEKHSVVPGAMMKCSLKGKHCLQGEMVRDTNDKITDIRKLKFKSERAYVKLKLMARLETRWLPPKHLVFVSLCLISCK